MNKKWINLLLGVIISIVLLYVVFRQVQLKEVISYIYTARKTYILASLILNFGLLLLRSYRLKFIIDEYKNFAVLKFFESIILGLFFNTILPFRAGDVVQGIMISKKTGLPKSITLTTVVMERFIDLFPPIIFIIIGSFLITLPKEISIFLTFFVLFVLVLCIVTIWKFGPYLTEKIENLNFTNKLVMKIIGFIKKFLLTVGSMKRDTIVCKIIPLTLLLWSGYSMGMFLICLSLDIKLPSVFAGFIIQAITALSVIIPSSPGYIGSWEFMGTVALSIFRVEKTKSVSFGLLSHIIGTIPVVVLGVVYLLKETGLISYVKQQTQENTNL